MNPFYDWIRQIIAIQGNTEENPLVIGNVEFFIDDANNVVYSIPTIQWNVAKVNEELYELVKKYNLIK